jgi:hypothetical protein
MVDSLSGSTQANESVRAVKGKSTNKRSKFTTSLWARFALGVIPKTGNRRHPTSRKTATQP